MIFGEYDEALDKQEQEKYLKEEIETARESAMAKGEEKGEKRVPDRKQLKQPEIC